jgi:RNA ligase (TIGR02306 family)
MRKMASIQKIAEVKPIDGADFIVSYRVNGWNVVDKKDAYQVGDLVVYIEIDAWCPNSLCSFLSKGREPREFNGVKGEKLRTVRLRGTYSQGLILPFSVMNVEQDGIVYESLADVDTDVSEILNIQRWEPPIPACLAGKMKGNFPSFIPKTDQTRIENLNRELEKWKEQELQFTIEEKLEGSSFCGYVYNDREGVCSRNIDLHETEDNTYWQMAKKYDILNKIKSTGKNLAIYGETLGNGIQGNIYNITGHDLYIFDIYLIDERRYMLPSERYQLVNSLGLKSVPVIGKITIDDRVDQKMLIEMAEGKSALYNTEREGIVVKCNTENISFKAISRKYLSKQKD